MFFSLKEIINFLKKNKIDVICNSHTNIKISNASTLKKSKKNYISFYHNIKYKNDLINTSATACFVSFKDKKLLPKNTIALVTKDPHKAFICVLNLLLPKISSNGIISKKALIHKNSMIGKNVEIQDNVIIKENVHIGDNSIICSNTTVNKNVKILDNVLINNNCSISNCIIGSNSKIQQGVSLGSDGFGFALNSNDYTDLYHMGLVIIGNNVSIGSNSSIDRGSIEDTIIGNNVRIDNLVHIAHNVKIGDNCIIAGQCGIAGSTQIGKKVMMGGQVGISGHLKIGNNVKIAAKSGVIKDVGDNATIGGYPAQDIKDWHRGTIKLYKK